MTKVQRTVLIVDDAKEDRLMIRRALRQDPSVEYHFLEVENGAQALACLQQQHSDCLLIDYHLPDTSGLQLLRTIVQAAPNRYPIVMLTGVSSATVAVQALQQGAHEFLSKNAFGAEQLQRAVHNAMEKATLRRQLEEQREWFYLTLASIGEGVIATDIAGCITFMNPVAERLTGWRATAAQGLPLTQVFVAQTESIGQPITDPVITVLRTGQAISQTNLALLVHQSRHMVPIDYNAAPIQDQQGHLRGVVLTIRDVSERKMAEERLRASEAKLNTILDNIPAAVYMLAPDHRYLFVNRCFAVGYNQTEAEIVGLSAFDRFPPEIAETLAANERRVLESRQAIAIEEAAPRDGVMHYYTTVKAPVLDEQGNPYAIIGISLDITDRKRAEEALRQSEERYRTLFETMDEGFCIFEMIFDEENRPCNYRFLEVNPAFARMTGLQDAVGKTARELVPDLEPHWFEIYGKVALTGEAHRFVEGAAAMGRWFDVYAFRHGGPESRRVALLFNNITARKRAEEEVQRSRNLLQRMAEASPDNISIYDLRQQQMIFNNRQLGMTDFSGQTVWETTPAEIDSHIHPADVEQTQQEFQRLYTAADGEVVETVFRWRFSDGTYRWLQDRTVVFARDPQGQVTQHLSISTDITDRKQAELNQQFLLDLAATLGQVSDAALIPQIVVERVGQYLDVSRCIFTAVDLASDQATVLAGWRAMGESPLATVTPLSAHVTPAYIAQAQAGQTLVVSDAYHDERPETAQALLVAHKLPATIRVPCLRDGQWVASLHVLQNQPRLWRVDEVQLVESVVQHFWPLVEKARAEAALRRQEEFVRQIADNIPGLVGYVGTDERYHFVNRTFETWFQRPRQQIIDGTVTQLIGAEERHRLADYRRQALQGEPVSYESAFTYPDGVTRAVWGRYQPDFAADGRVLGFYLFVMDITERKQAEVALYERTALLQGLMESTPDLIWAKDRAGRMTLANQAALDFLGNGRPEQVLGYSATELAPDPIQAETILTNDERIMAQGVTEIVEEAFGPPNHLLYFRTAKAPLRNRTGDVVGIVGISTDITERKQAEADLRFLADLAELIRLADDADELLAAVAQRVGNHLQVDRTLFYEIDRVQDVLLLRSHYSRTRPPLTQAMPLSLFSPATRSELYAGRTLSVENTETDSRTQAFYATVYAPYQAQAFISVPFLQEGTWRSQLTVMTPTPRTWQAREIQLLETITERVWLTVEKLRLTADLRANEERLRQLNATLEQRVEERTHQLEEKNLQLERSNTELEKFAYVASHDLRSPLRAIDNLSQWVAEDAGHLLPATSKEHLAKMQGRVRRMDKLLDDLLAYSRVGRFSYTVENIDLQKLLQDIIGLLNAPPAFQMTITDALPTLRAQRVPLEMVLRNLVGNTIKHHHRPDGHLQITVHEEGQWLHFTVSDDGPGIDPLFHEKIFEIFQTLKPRDSVEGSGMGLAIVKKAVELVGGTITVESSVGAGATFRFTWPKTPAPVAAT